MAAVTGALWLQLESVEIDVERFLATASEALRQRRDGGADAARMVEARSMSDTKQRPSAPAFVVLRQVGEGRWELVGEVERTRGLTARAARSRAILEATGGNARAGDVYAAVLRSEWRVALDWVPADD